MPALHSPHMDTRVQQELTCMQCTPAAREFQIPSLQMKPQMFSTAKKRSQHGDWKKIQKNGTPGKNVGRGSSDTGLIRKNLSQEQRPSQCQVSNCRQGCVEFALSKLPQRCGIVGNCPAIAELTHIGRTPDAKTTQSC